MTGKRCKAWGNGDWDSGTIIVKPCEFVDKREKPLVEIAAQVQAQIVAMNRAMGNVEWLGYLLGEHHVQEDSYEISGMLIPEQEVTAASVDVIGDYWRKDIVGTVHSHHRMGAFFSGTDDTYVAANHAITIVVADSGWKVKARKHLPCGAYTHVDAELTFRFPEVNTGRFIRENRGKVKEKRVVTPLYPYLGQPGRTLIQGVGWVDNEELAMLGYGYF